MTDPLWFKDAVFYQVYVRAFADGNGDGHGDFRGLTSKLDYFAELGVSCLWIMPMYPSPLLDDGYDIADYYQILNTYGTVEDLKTFIAEAHKRGLRVIADLVLNHTSDQHAWFQAARADRNSPYRDYYVRSDTDEKYKDARIIFIDSQKSNWTWDEQAGQYFWHRFYPSQPDLNFDNPAVQAEMLNVIKFWLDMGLDGYRADAVPYLFEREGTSCENLPETHAYLKTLRHYIDKQYPGANRILLAEANQWPQDLRPYFGEGDEFHMAFHFPVMPRIFKALATGDVTPVIDILKDTPQIPENCQWGMFLRNHDELTLEMVTPEDREFMWNTYASDPRMRLNLGIRRRLAPLLEGDQRKIHLAQSILLTLPGSPVLYYGDEIGMGDNIWLHDRNGVRTPMQWDASPNAGFSTAPADTLYAPVIDDETYGYKKVNVVTQREQTHSLWSGLRRMLKARKLHQAFSRGTCEFITVSNRSILAFTRTHDNETVLVVHNLSDQTHAIAIDLSRWQGKSLHDLITETDLPPVGSEPYTLKLGPYESLWLK
jgi:maltose alpha-D-glucosyltransferase / alpha-amylase